MLFFAVSAKPFPSPGRPRLEKPLCASEALFTCCQKLFITRTVRYLGRAGCRRFVYLSALLRACRTVNNTHLRAKRNGGVRDGGDVPGKLLV